jgi:hypothetical protein
VALGEQQLRQLLEAWLRAVGGPGGGYAAPEGSEPHRLRLAAMATGAVGAARRKDEPSTRQLGLLFRSRALRLW